MYYTTNSQKQTLFFKYLSSSPELPSQFQQKIDTNRMRVKRLNSHNEELQPSSSGKK
jgi:hypothetical protein